jgi:2-oxoglutarate dehydrogenase E1 component
MIGEFGVNAGYVEELHARYRESPQNVDPEWRAFFEGVEGAPGLEVPRANGAANAPAPRTAAATAPPPSAATPGASTGNGANGTHATTSPSVAPYSNGAAAARKDRVLEAGLMQGRVYQLLNAYRVRGHLFAAIDPLGKPREAAPELELENFGLRETDLDTVFPAVGIGGLGDKATLRQIIAHLEGTYCRTIGVEFTHIEDPEMRGWLQSRMESTGNRAALDRSETVRILTKLTDAEIFEQFIHKNYVGAKRFSLEGAESMIAMLDLLIESAGANGVDEIIIGMAHRGRLNVLVNIMGKDPRELFAQFDDKNARKFLGGGDVKYHLGYSSDRMTASGANVHLSLAFNPSHLEFVNPVVEGRVRAKQDRGRRRTVLPLLIHGDAAFIGQGVVPETLNLAGLEGYSTGGTVHLVVNNQVGFTTNPSDSRSTRYCTDITRMLKVPVFHVNGEDPEAVIQVTRLAMEFRQRFAQDVVIDMYCYRRYGHNEADEPRFTQPLMYARIDAKPTVREVYVQRLVATEQVTAAEAAQIGEERRASLEKAHTEARDGDFLHAPNAMGGVWKPYIGGPDAKIPEVATGVSRDILLDLLDRITHIPEGFHANPKAQKIVEARQERVLKQDSLFWETAEALAFASLLREGSPIRLSGQDSRRGTFSHRHAVLYDTRTGTPYTPLDHLTDGLPQGRFQVWDSPLSETGVLGFEYGYSLDTPEGLVIWEAQFGDFANGGQVIVDQFIASAEDKWLRLSGLVLLLPHGYEGQGPEHSSARIERWLQMAAEDNIQICNPTTPAQFFHLLRRQVRRPWRKPLAVMTPKSLLRNPVATSKLEDLVSGEFHRVIGDDLGTNPKDVKRVLLTSGKVFYDLHKAREERKRTDVAIVRLEQYYPLGVALNEVLEAYPAGTDLVWVQEEPGNMGAWYFLKAHLPDHLKDRFPLRVVSRAESASPATGSKASHELEQKMLVDEAFA